MSGLLSPVQRGRLERAWDATVLSSRWYGAWLRWLLAALVALTVALVWRLWLPAVVVGVVVFSYLTRQERRLKRRLAAEQAWRDREAAIELQAEAVRRGTERARPVAPEDEGGGP